MQCTYKLRTDTIHDEHGTEFTVFGITATDSSGKTLDSIPDIFFEQRECEKLISLCNSEELDLIHLHDVVDDWLNSF